MKNLVFLFAAVVFALGALIGGMRGVWTPFEVAVVTLLCFVVAMLTERKAA